MSASCDAFDCEQHPGPLIPSQSASLHQTAHLSFPSQHQSFQGPCRRSTKHMDQAVWAQWGRRRADISCRCKGASFCQCTGLAGETTLGFYHFDTRQRNHNFRIKKYCENLSHQGQKWTFSNKGQYLPARIDFQDFFKEKFHKYLY